MLQNGIAQFAVVLLPLLVDALAQLLTANRTHRTLHGTAYAYFLLDAAVDFRDQILIGLGTHHIGIALQITIHITCTGNTTLVIHHFGAVNAGILAHSRPIVVKNATLPHEQLGQLLQSLCGKALVIPVDLVIAQMHTKGIYLILAQRLTAEPIDQIQILPAHRYAVSTLGLFYNFHFVSPLICSAWARYSSALASSTMSCKLMSSHFTCTPPP